jgi:hypothetical protein
LIIADLETKKEEKASAETIDMPTILTYAKYFVEHLKDLLVDHCNPVLKAKYFSVIFDQVPSYAELQCGIANIPQIPGVNELFKLAHDKNISLVHQCDLSWNRIESSLLLMYEKLVWLNIIDGYCQ